MKIMQSNLNNHILTDSEDIDACKVADRELKIKQSGLDANRERIEE